MSQEFKLSTRDLFHLISYQKRKLFGLIIACSLLLVLYALISPIRYRAEGSFREKGKSNPSFDTKAAMVLISGNQRDSEIEPIFKSRRVLSGVVESLGLQAIVDPSPQEPGIIQRFFYNLWIEWAYFKNVDEPLFQDPVEPFRFVNLDYPYDERRFFTLLLKDGVIHLRDKKSGAEYTGEAFRRISGDGFKMIVIPQDAIEGQIYNLTLLPFTKAIKDITAGLKVQADKNDKSLIKLIYTSKNRIQSKEVIDALMSSYLSYLEEEQRIIHERQIGYLEGRQHHSFDVLKKKMEQHAQEVAKDALHHGFIGSDKAIQFFAAHQEQLQGKREQTEFMIKALRDLTHQDSIPSERLVGMIDLPLMAQKLQQLGEMKSLRDSLSLALWDPAGDWDQEKFASRVDEWEQLQNQASVIDRLIVSLDEKGMVEPSDHFKGKAQFFVDFWQDQLNKSLTAFQEGSKENFYPLFNDLCRKKESFRNYLVNLKNFVDVQSTTLQEELIHSKDVDEEFKGIDLTLSQDLFKRYMISLEELQAQERHLGFLKEEIQDDGFAISSLSTILSDTIAQDLVNRAASLEMAIRDPKNRSDKEQSRMRDELNLERNFLSMHIDQTLQLNQIKQGLIKEKFTSLQRATLGFLHRQISFFEHQVKELVHSKIESLEQEKELYQEQIQNLGDQLATYPDKWVRDELLKQAMQLQQLQAQEITRLVESKNIAANLELVQSSPLDGSFAPPLPVFPMITLFAILGCFLGSLIGVSAILGSALLNGIPATRRNLGLQGQTVLGEFLHPEKPLSGFLNEDLETFRSIFASLVNSGSKSVLVAGCKGQWAETFSEYLSQTGKKTLYLSLDFQTPFDESGLYHYLKEGQSPQILNHKIHFGGTTRSYLELLSQESFKSLLVQLKKDYCLIVAYLPCEASSSSVKFLSSFFDSTILTVKDETLERLEPMMAAKHYSFVIASIKK